MEREAAGIMNRPETTKMLSEHLERHIKAYDARVYWAREVTFDYGTTHAGRVDYMRYKPKNNTISGIEIHDIECERSKARADYNVQSGAEIVKEAREKAGLL